MATRVTLETMNDDRVAVVKTSLSGDRTDRSAEATWLASARHRGVVRLLSTTKDPIVLRTLHAGGTTMRTEDPRPALAAPLLTDLSITLADLHDRELVHGQLTLDHLIITNGRLVLCSPSGTASDPTKDLLDFGGCLQALLQRWAEAGVDIPFEQDWQHLLHQLQDPHEGYSARRAARELARLTAKIDQSRFAEDRMAAATNSHSGNPSSTDTQTESQKSRASRLGLSTNPLSGRGLLAGTMLAALAMVGLWINQSAATEPDTGAQGPEVVIKTDLYRIAGTSETGSDDDVALGLGQECSKNGEVDEGVVYLSATTDHVWFFASPVSDAVALAVVPGGTTLRLDDDCQSVWVAGPAGQTQLALPS